MGGDERPLVVVVGLGPSLPSLFTREAEEALESSSQVFVRTSRHPSASSLIEKGAIPLDHHYEQSHRFEEAYEGIVEELVEAAISDGKVTYAVPGSPFVGESTVSMLQRDARVRVEAVPGLSFMDLAFDRLGIDPLTSRVRLVDGASFVEDAAGETGPLLVAQLWSRTILSDMKVAIDPGEATRAVLLHHLGLEDEVVIEVAWEDLDRVLEPDHLTCAYVRDIKSPVGYELARLIEVVRVLRHSCPWDAEQSHRSLSRHLLEETYEAIEAIDELGDGGGGSISKEGAGHLEEELGDVLCQVIYHTTIGAEEGIFDLSDVATTAHEKLVVRHPHVFSDRRDLTDADSVGAAWEQLKQKEKGRKSLLEGIPSALPALSYTAKLERRLESVGFGLDMLDDAETRETLLGLVDGLDLTNEESMGQVLLVLGRLSARSGIDPEECLRRAVHRLKERFLALETHATETGEELSRLSSKKMRDLFAG